MSDTMIDRESVIRQLTQHIARADYIETDWMDCVSVPMLRGALALLKEQEPRVLALEEVEDLPYGHVLIETDKNGSLRWLDALLFCKNANFSFDFITLEGRARLLGTEYNREWRCWSAKPTDEQREAVPWQE